MRSGEGVSPHGVRTLAEDGVNRSPRPVVRVGPGMAVGVERLGGRRVPESGLDRLHRFAVPDQQAGAEVPQGVQGDAAQTGLLHRRTPDSLGEGRNSHPPGTQPPRPRGRGGRPSPNVSAAVGRVPLGRREDSQTRPASWTQSAIWTRLAIPSLTRMCETWALTVARLMYSSPAISALDLPRPTATATSRLRSLRLVSLAVAVLARSSGELSGGAATIRRISCEVTLGDSIGSPAATFSIAATIIGGDVSLRMNPVAPCASARTT